MSLDRGRENRSNPKGNVDWSIYLSAQPVHTAEQGLDKGRYGWACAYMAGDGSYKVLTEVVLTQRLQAPGAALPGSAWSL